MLNDIGLLSDEELKRVKEMLLELLDSLEDPKAHGKSGKLSPDEETVFRSLKHPERGDVTITILKDENTGKLDVFVGNRRDATTPFALMHSKDIRKYSGRRTVDGSRVDPEFSRVGIFLPDDMDLSNLTDKKLARIDVYSSQFGLVEPAKTVAADDDFTELKTKKISECGVREKWIIYKKDWDYDGRRGQIEKDLFEFEFSYAKYNQPEKEETLKLTPTRYQRNIGQLIRDIYPPGVKKVLKIDFPEDHRKKLDECREVLSRLVALIGKRMSTEGGEEYYLFLKEVQDFVDGLVKFDPELSAFT